MIRETKQASSQTKTGIIYVKGNSSAGTISDSETPSPPYPSLKDADLQSLTVEKESVEEKKTLVLNQTNITNIYNIASSKDGPAVVGDGVNQKITNEDNFFDKIIKFVLEKILRIRKKL